MKHQKRILQGLKLAAVLAVALSMGACANKGVGCRMVDHHNHVGTAAEIMDKWRHKIPAVAAFNHQI